MSSTTMVLRLHKPGRLDPYGGGMINGDRSIRTINQEIQAALADGYSVSKGYPFRHNLGIGLPAGAEGSLSSVGYYCAGLNNGATVEIERNAAGTGRLWHPVTSRSMDGHVGRRLHARRTIHVRGDCVALRCGNEGWGYYR